MTIILLLIIILLLYLIRNFEKFNVTNNHNFYMRFRDLIDDRDTFPYKISDTCFVDKYRRCNGDNMCQMCALEQCKGPPMISESYPFF
jgi:hypothetical protein